MEVLKLKRTLLLITAVLLFVSIVLSPTAAAIEDDTDAKTVRVGYVIFENYQEGGDGEYKRGFGYEYLQRVAYHTGWNYEYVYGSFGDLLQKLKDGKIDLMGDLSYTEERAETISFSALSQGKENFFIYTMPDQKEIDPFEPDTINGRKIGVTANSYQQGLLTAWLAESGYDCVVAEYPSSSETAAALNNGEVDAMITTDMASRGGYVPFVNIGHAEFYFGVNKNRPDPLEELNRAMREIQTADPYFNEATYSKYITSSLSNSYLSLQEQKWLEAHDFTVHLGYLTGNLPYCDATDENTVKGLLSVLIDTLETGFNIRVEANEYASIEALSVAIKDGEVDLFGPMYSDFWLAEQYGLINSNTITSTKFILLYQGDYTEETTKKIAYAQSNAIQNGALQVLYPDAEHVKCDDREACLEAIVNGDATCTIVSAATLNLYKQYKAMNAINMLELPNAVEICLATEKGNSELLNIINRVIFASKEDLNGAALMENAFADISFSLGDYLQEHSQIVILILIVIIALMLIFFFYYHRMTSRLIKMRAKNVELSQQAFHDGLTKIGNRSGYLLAEKELQMKIDAGEHVEFALLVADVNSLKTVNDAHGHEFGDLLIQNCSKCICTVCAHSPVFRIGGDEFAVILTGEDYTQRDVLLAKLQEKNLVRTEALQIKNGESSLAFGMAEYDPETDRIVADVFARADKAMYDCKKRMKQLN